MSNSLNTLSDACIQLQLALDRLKAIYTIQSRNEFVTLGDIHPYSNLNLEEEKALFSAILKDARKTIDDYRQSCLFKSTNATGDGAALRKYFSLLKEESGIEEGRKQFRASVEQSLIIVKQACADNEVQRKFLISQLRTLCEDLGLTSYLDEPDMNDPDAISEVTVGGRIIVIDVSIDKLGDVQNASITYVSPYEANVDPKVDECLKYCLRSRNFNVFKDNLTFLAFLDSQTADLKDVDLFHTMKCIERDMEQLFKEERKHVDIVGLPEKEQHYHLAREGYGVPVNNLYYLGPSFIYWIQSSYEALSWADDSELSIKEISQKDCYKATIRAQKSSSGGSSLLTSSIPSFILSEDDMVDNNIFTIPPSKFLQSPPKLIEGIRPSLETIQFYLQLDPPVMITWSTLMKMKKLLSKSEEKEIFQSQLDGSLSLQEYYILQQVGPENASKAKTQYQNEKHLFCFTGPLSNGLLISRIPITHFGQMYPILSLIRRHAKLNGLFASCYQSSSSTSGAQQENSLVIEISMKSLDFKLDLLLCHSISSAMAHITIAIDESNATSVSSSGLEKLMTNQEMVAIIDKVPSIPELLKKIEEKWNLTFTK